MLEYWDRSSTLTVINTSLIFGILMIIAGYFIGFLSIFIGGFIAALITGKKSVSIISTIIGLIGLKVFEYLFLSTPMFESGNPIWQMLLLSLVLAIWSLITGTIGSLIYKRISVHQYLK